MIKDVIIHKENARGAGGTCHFGNYYMPSKKPGKITFEGKIDPRLIPIDATPGYEIVDAKVTDTAVEVWLSDGSVILTPLSY